MKRTEVGSIVMRRTEQGKKLRKLYETHQIHHGFNEYREMDVKWGGGVSNTISTVLKDFLIFEVWKR